MMANIVTSHELVGANMPIKDQVALLRPLHAEAQIVAVTNMLSQSRFGLQVAIAAQNLPGIVECKVKAAAIEEMAKQLQLGKDMELDTAEFVRRAERGLGVAIRQGQVRGEIETHIEAKSRAGKARQQGVTYNLKPRPTDFAGKYELTNSQGGIYHLTDGVSDADFEAVIVEARGEANLSRANVARKARARSKPVTEPDLINDETAPPVRKTARARKTVQRMAIELHGWATVIADLNPAEVQVDEVTQEIRSITESMCSIRKFMKAVEDIP